MKKECKCEIMENGVILELDKNDNCIHCGRHLHIERGVMVEKKTPMTPSNEKKESQFIEERVAELKNKYGLNGLHAQPIGYMRYEDVTERVLDDIRHSLELQRQKFIEEREKEQDDFIGWLIALRDTINGLLKKYNPPSN